VLGFVKPLIAVRQVLLPQFLQVSPHVSCITVSVISACADFSVLTCVHDVIACILYCVCIGEL
jgi:hypothetical protein